MAYGMIGYGQAGSVVSTLPAGTSQMLPSGTIFGDCQAAQLIDEGNGFFVFKDFKSDLTLPGLPNQNGTYTIGASTDSALDISFSSTANAVMFTQPMAPVVAGGNTKMWYEVAVAPQQVTAQHYFFGLVTSAGLSSTIFASSTTLTSTNSFIGFFTHADAPTNIDAVYGKSGVAPVTVLANVLTANANNPNPANVNYVPATAPGAWTATGSTNWVKLGLRVDKTYVYFYVNGTQVAKKQLDATFDQTNSYGGIVAAGTKSTNNTDHVQVSFFRTAGKIAGQV